MRTYDSTQIDAIIVKVKALLFITTSDYDTYFDQVIPMILQDAEEYCHVYFSEENDAYGEDGEFQYTMNIPQGVYMYIAKAVEENLQKLGVASESQGKRSVSYGTSNEMPPINYIKDKYLIPYRKVAWSGKVDFEDVVDRYDISTNSD